VDILPFKISLFPSTLNTLNLIRASEIIIEASRESFEISEDPGLWVNNQAQDLLELVFQDIMPQS